MYLKLNNRLFSLTWETNSGGFILFFYPRLPNKDRLLRHSCNFPVVSEPINSRWYITIWWLEGWGWGSTKRSGDAMRGRSKTPNEEIRSYQMPIQQTLISIGLEKFEYHAWIWTKNMYEDIYYDEKVCVRHGGRTAANSYLYYFFFDITDIERFIYCDNFLLKLVYCWKINVSDFKYSRKFI